jgi:RND family efflux transporter MFP subunit
MHKWCSSRRQIIFTSTLLLLCMLASLLYGCGPSSDNSGSTGQEPPTPTPLPTTAALAKPVYTVERGDVVEVIEFSGRIAPEEQYDLFFRSPGRVRKLYVKEGERVSAGQLLADLEGIDDLERQKRINELNQRRAGIHAEMAQLALDLFKIQTPASSKGYAEMLAMQERELELADLAVEEAGLYGQGLEEAVNNAKIFAPIDGEVLSMDLREGRDVAAYTPVMVVADPAHLEVSAELLSEELSKLSVDMPATISAVLRPGDPLAGHVRRLPGSLDSSAASQVEQTTRIAFDENPSTIGLELGDLVTVLVETQYRNDAIWLPPQAIRSFEGRRFVIVQDGDVQRRVDVRVGLQGQDRVEILDGLEAGQEVLGP